MFWSEIRKKHLFVAEFTAPVDRVIRLFLVFLRPISDGHRFKGDDKMVYETPYIEIVSFDECDVITWSSLNVESSGDGDWENFGDLFGWFILFISFYVSASVGTFALFIYADERRGVGKDGFLRVPISWFASRVSTLLYMAHRILRSAGIC